MKTSSPLITISSAEEEVVKLSSVVTSMESLLSDSFASANANADSNCKPVSLLSTTSVVSFVTNGL